MPTYDRGSRSQSGKKEAIVLAWRQAREIAADHDHVRSAASLCQKGDAIVAHACSRRGYLQHEGEAAKVTANEWIVESK
jgi:hypothetical protein